MRVIVKFIDDNRQEFGVEPIVRVLKRTPARIATSSYYAYKKRPVSARALRDKRLKVVIKQVFEDNYCVYGVRKIWHTLRREHGDEFGQVARCTVERLMRELGIRGIGRRKKQPRTTSVAAKDCPDDLVNRDFWAGGPNCLWVADITYIPTRAGWVYAAFILDVHTREIVGWQVTNHLRGSLATDALNMALSARYRAGESVAGLIHHSDRGVQYRAVRYAEALGDSQAVASVGSKGDSFDNAMAEALNSVYKGELIDRREWSGLVEVMAATAEWIGWYNTARLHSALGYRTPYEFHYKTSSPGILQARAA